MLTRIEIENFYSIRDREVLDLTISSGVPENKEHFLDSAKTRVPKVVAVYGANASGKTTFLKAIDFVAKFVGGSVSWEENKSSTFLNFMTMANASKPTRFYVELTSDLFSAQGEPHLLSYELVFEPIALGKKTTQHDSHIIKYESLKYKLNEPNTRFRRIFERDEDGIKSSSYFDVTDNDMRLDYVGKTSSVLTTLAKFNHELSRAMVDSTNTVQSNIDILGDSLTQVPGEHKAINKYYFDNKHVLDNLNSKVRIIDLGIDKIYVKEHGEEIKTAFKHKGLDIALGWSFESSGTKSFFKMFPHINYVLETGGVAVIDEIDRDIHPLLLPEILRWFYDEDINKHGAQLIMSCHNASLMENLVKEEIFFTEKNDVGHTEIYGLKEIDGVRRDANIYAKYLNGVYGGIPVVG